jgi:hypothetical protein
MWSFTTIPVSRGKPTTEIESCRQQLGLIEAQRPERCVWADRLNFDCVQTLKRADDTAAFFSLRLGKITFDVCLPPACTSYRRKQREGFEA